MEARFQPSKLRTNSLYNDNAEALKQKLQTDYKIPTTIWSELPAPPSNIHNKFLSYIAAFKDSHHIPAWMRYIWQDPKKYGMLFMLSSDDYAATEKFAALDLSCIQIALYMQSNNICKKWFAVNPHMAIYLLDTAAHAGNLAMVTHLLNPNAGFNLKPTQKTLSCALESGNLALVQLLLEPQFKLELNDDVLIDQSNHFNGNLALNKFLIEQKNLSAKFLERYLLSSLESGDLTILEDLVKEKRITEWRLGTACSSGSVVLVDKLCDEFGLKPKKLDLLIAIEHGRLELVKHLVKKYNLSITIDCLHTAAYGGQREMAAFLLNPDNKFDITVDQEAVIAARKSGNLLLVDDLLRNQSACLSWVYNEFPVLPGCEDILERCYATGLDHLISAKTVVEEAAKIGNLKLVFDYLNPNNTRVGKLLVIRCLSEVSNMTRSLNTQLIPSLLAAYTIRNGLSHAASCAERIIKDIKLGYEADKFHFLMFLGFVLKDKKMANNLEIVVQKSNLAPDIIADINQAIAKSRGVEIDLKERKHAFQM